MLITQDQRSIIQQHPACKCQHCWQWWSHQFRFCSHKGIQVSERLSGTDNGKSKSGGDPLRCSWLQIKGLERNESPNRNSMGYKLLTCLRDNPTSLWHLSFQREPWKQRLSFYLACWPREIATGNAPWLAACVHSLKKPKSLFSCMTMPAAKSTFLWPCMIVVILLKAYHLIWIIS